MPKKISKTPEEGEYTTIKIPNDLVTNADKLIGKYGYKSRGEIVKTAVRDLLVKYREPESQKEISRFEHINMDGNGAKILDRQLREVVQVHITRDDGIKCEHCETDECKHVDFALTIPDIIDTIRKRKQEGWNLPNI